MLGHTSLKHLLDVYFTELKNQEHRTTFPFLIIEGPAHTGKLTLIKKYIHELIGAFERQDFCFLQDLSIYTGKEHLIKVDIDEQDQWKDIEGHGKFFETGIRQINNRLALSPAGTYKIVLIEHLERLHGPSANAFLKTLEEPLEKRIIIATTTSLELILPTIQSRAMIARTQGPQHEEMLSFLHTKYPHISPEDLATLSSICRGAIGAIIKKIEGEYIQSITEYQELFTIFATKKFGRASYLLLQKMYLQDPSLLDILIEKSKNIGDIKNLIQAKKYIRTNGMQDHVLFSLGYGCLI